MEEGFCDLVSPTDAWPQKLCWEDTSVMLIWYMNIFFSGLWFRTKVQSGKQGIEKESGLSYFTMFQKGWRVVGDSTGWGCGDWGQSEGPGLGSNSSLNLVRNIP